MSQTPKLNDYFFCEAVAQTIDYFEGLTLAELNFRNAESALKSRLKKTYESWLQNEAIEAARQAEWEARHRQTSADADNESVDLSALSPVLTTDSALLSPGGVS